MKISPCNNCKKRIDCTVPRFLQENTHLGVFKLADEMINMPVLVSIVSLNRCKEDGTDEVTLECDAVEYIHKSNNTYEALLNSKPQDDDCCTIGAALRDRCKKGDCGGCSGH